MHAAVNTQEFRSSGIPLPAHVPDNITNAIYKASTHSGVDFSYLVNQAKAESNFNPTAKAKTSSATGLYQFIDSTWLQMVDRYGAEYGLDTAGMNRRDILDMRKDPEAASFMAAAFASENEKFLNSHWGGEVGATELYFAHFLGASGAASFLNARDENPVARAADLFPKAARANYGVFFDRESGDPRTLEQVYQFFDRKFQTQAHDMDEHVQEVASGSPPPLPGHKPDFIAERTVPTRAMGDHPIMQRSHAMRLAMQTAGERDLPLSGQISGRAFLQEHILTQAVSPQSTLSGVSQTRSSALYQRSDTYKKQHLPPFSLITQPVDVMLLTQTVVPQRVIAPERS